MSETVETKTLRAVLKSQYRAGLAMLREAIERCTDELWLADGRRNAYWQVAYHALFFTHLYLHTDIESFRPWAGHQSAVQNPDGLVHRSAPDRALPLIPQPYTRAQALEYWDVCSRLVESAVEGMDLHRPDCGFPWYRLSKLEHQLVNVRHLQHHCAQLADRLRADLDIGIRWVGGAGEIPGS